MGDRRPVVRLVAEGTKNREIAQKLRAKEHSIRNYIYRIFEKLGASSRVETILYMFGTEIVAIKSSWLSVSVAFETCLDFV